LRGVVRFGAQTVPALARLRFVTRQHLQEREGFEDTARWRDAFPRERPPLRSKP
jgi:hypothetical protein